MHEHRCNPCEQREARARNLAETYPDRQLPPGVMFSVERRTQTAAGMRPPGGEPIP